MTKAEKVMARLNSEIKSDLAFVKKVAKEYEYGPITNEQAIEAYEITEGDYCKLKEYFLG